MCCDRSQHNLNKFAARFAASSAYYEHMSFAPRPLLRCAVIAMLFSCGDVSTPSTPPPDTAAPDTASPDAAPPHTGSTRAALIGGGHLSGGTLSADVTIGGPFAQRSTTGGTLVATPISPITR